MAEQIIDAELRQQIARWTRAALGELVESEDNGIANQTPIDSMPISGGNLPEKQLPIASYSVYSKGRGTPQRLIDRLLRRKERRDAYSGGRGRATPGVPAAPGADGRAS